MFEWECQTTSYNVSAIVFRCSLKVEKRRLGDNDSQRKQSFVWQKQVFILQVSLINEIVVHINKFSSATFFPITIRSILPYPGVWRPYLSSFYNKST